MDFIQFGTDSVLFSVDYVALSANGSSPTRAAAAFKKPVVVI
jgi:hypothetical protein